MRLKGKVVLITGAGGQLGKSFAHAFAKEGAQLWLADNSEIQLANTVNELDRDAVIGGLVFDVSEPKEVEDAFSEIKKSGLSLDVTVNNAGIGVFSPFWEREYDEFLKVLSVNVGGTFLCIRESLKLMQSSQQGSIVNIGSIYGVVSSDPKIYTDCTRVNSEVYSASKAAVIQMTKYFAVHAADMGVRVNCVSPGGVFNNQGENFELNYSRRTPAGRMAKDSEISGAVIYLACQESAYVTGQNIIVDGGLTVW